MSSTAKTDTAAFTAEIQITDAALAQVRSIQERESLAGHVLRVSVVGGGCSGMSYRMGFVEAANPTDTIIEREGVQLAIDPKSMLYLQGTVIDFADGLTGKGFTFINPNAKKSCGCGSSFSG
jgi:iron-sulfur cluster assembly protein